MDTSEKRNAKIAEIVAGLKSMSENLNKQRFRFIFTINQDLGTISVKDLQDIASLLKDISILSGLATLFIWQI